MTLHKTTTIMTHDGNGGLRFYYAVVHSVDGGRTWASQRRDLGAYYRRQLEEREECQTQFERINTGEVYDVRY